MESPEKEVSQYFLLLPHPQKCCTAISLLTSICPDTHKYLSFYKYLPKGQEIFTCVLAFPYRALSCFLNHSIILQLCATNVACQQTPPCLKASLPAETLCNVGGAASFRTAEESVENAKEILNAFDRAILKHKNRPKIEVPKRKLPPPTSRFSLVFSSFYFRLQYFYIRQR